MSCYFLLPFLANIGQSIITKLSNQKSNMNVPPLFPYDMCPPEFFDALPSFKRHERKLAGVALSNGNKDRTSLQLSSTNLLLSAHDRLHHKPDVQIQTTWNILSVQMQFNYPSNTHILMQQLMLAWHSKGDYNI